VNEPSKKKLQLFTDKKSRFVVISLLLLLALLGFFLGTILTGKEDEASLPLPNENIEPQLPEPVFEPLPEPEPQPILNPLTHLPVADEAALERRIILVSIDNYKPARPQAGIGTADIMYELPAEGGISRLVALFFTDTPKIIGPVRSARPYIVDVAREWQGLFVHCGGSNDALNYLAKGHVNWLNEMSYSKYFWRDKTRHMPHNLFTSSENIYDFLEEKKWEQISAPRSFSFYDPAENPPASASKVDIIHIDYPDKGNRNSYVYDHATMLYARSIGDEPHIDTNTEAQVLSANILVQLVKAKVLDSVGRLEINLVGTGEAMLFTRGTMQEGTWKRESLDSPTYFCDSDGEEWLLSPGQTWIQICDGTTKVTYEDSTLAKEPATPEAVINF